MAFNRREFLRTIGVAGVSASTLGRSAQAAERAEWMSNNGERMGVLVDLANCIGCRKCEYACQEAAGFDVAPIETFEDRSVFEKMRRPEPRKHTVVNRFENPDDPEKPIHVKTNCMHCNDPACVSACLVGAFQKEANGAVTYDASKCMGCRYCMVACPFQIPTYEYDNAFTPQVRKCDLCHDRIAKEGGVPACVNICPQECLTYGKRSELLELAHEKIAARPDFYVNHVYGEHEAGGTSWLYIASVPFERLGFPKLGPNAPPRLTEGIQHGVFKHWIPPLALFGLLGIIMRLTHRSELHGEALHLPILDARGSVASEDNNGFETGLGSAISRKDTSRTMLKDDGR
jgi:formate dehydrogenase iron-sulfur subunit